MDAVTYNESRGYTADTWRQVQAEVGAQVDGIPGPATAQAVAAWQGSQGLHADGKVGPATLNAITSAGCGGPGPEPALLDPTRDTRAIKASDPRSIFLDVSKWQGTIDWSALATWSKVSGVIIKATDGRGDQDPFFAEHWTGAIREEVPRGAFHVCHPLSYGKRGDPIAAAQEHAELVGDGGKAGSWLDYETQHVQEGVDLLGEAGLEDWTEELVAELKRLQGREPGMYWSHRGVDLFGSHALGFARLRQWWAAYYSDAPKPLPSTGLAPVPFYLPDGFGWDLWQFTSSARCVGIKSDVDCGVVNPDGALGELLGR